MKTALSPRVGVVIAVSLLLGACLSSPAGEVAASPGSGPSMRVALEWQEWGETWGPLDACSLRFSRDTKPFSKEPDLGRHRVVRGALGIGVRTNDFIGFAWDQTANRLYLDRNGNSDLTDDAEATYVGEYDGQLQLFPRVKLNVETPSGNHRVLVDLRLGGANPAQLHGSCVLRSFWQARLELGGRSYQIGLVENPDAKTLADESRYLLFRTWEARTEPVNLTPGTPHLVSWSKRVYLAGQAFGLRSHYAIIEGAGRYSLELTPAQTQLGELHLKGQDLYRLVLQQADGFTAVLDRPGSVEKLPVGTYQNAEVWLRHGTAEAFYMGGLPVTVGATGSASLAVGGPLTNYVAAEQRDNNLILNYRLLGADSRGLVYRMTTEDRANPPAWTIVAGEKTVGTGKFAYG